MKVTTVDSRQFEIGDDPMKVFNIASIPGDGVGKEVVPAAQRVLKAVSDVHGGLSFRFTEFPYSCEYYLEHGEMMPDDGLEQTLKEFDSIFLGAVGNSKLVPDHISLWKFCSLKSAANLNRSSTLDLRNICKESSLRWPTQKISICLSSGKTVKGNTARSEAESSGMKMKSPFKMPFFQEKGRRGRCALLLSWRLSGKSMSQAQQSRTESFIQCLFGMKSLRTRQKTTPILPQIHDTLTRCRPFL